MEKVFVWGYRLALVFPLTWLILGISWYCWIFLAFGEIPRNLGESAADKGLIQNLNWFSEIGIRVLIPAVWSFPFLVFLAWTNFMVLKEKKLAIQFNTRKILIYFLIYAMIWSLQLLPGPMSGYLNFIWDWTE